MVNVRRDAGDSGIPEEIWAAMSNLTLAGVPPGVKSDMSHREWHGSEAIIAAGLGLPIMILLSSIRIYAKCWINRKWDVDDSIFLSSLIAAIILISNQVALVSGGVIGFHAWEIRIVEVSVPVLAISLSVSILTGPLTWIIKLALFSLIYHTFRPLKYVRLLVYIGVTTSGLYYLGSAIMQGVFCGPSGGTDRKALMMGLGRESCISGEIRALTISMGVINVFFDVFLLIIPLRPISQLQLPKRKKIGVFFMFLTGIGTCVMSIVNLYYRTQLSYSHDYNFETIPFMTVSIIESCIGVVIPCMPPSAKVFNRAHKNVKSCFSAISTGIPCTGSTVSSRNQEEDRTFDSRDLESMGNNSHNHNCYDRKRDHDERSLNNRQQHFSHTNSVLYSSSTVDKVLTRMEPAVQRGWNDDTIRACL